MAMKAALPFNLLVIADGTSTTLTTNTSTGPFLYGGSDTYITAASLSTLMPAGTDGLVSSDGISISATIGLAGAITFTWASAPTAGEISVSGNLLFN